MWSLDWGTTLTKHKIHCNDYKKNSKLERNSDTECERVNKIAINSGKNMKS